MQDSDVKKKYWSKDEDRRVINSYEEANKMRPLTKQQKIYIYIEILLAFSTK